MRQIVFKLQFQVGSYVFQVWFVAIHVEVSITFRSRGNQELPGPNRR